MKPRTVHLVILSVLLVAPTCFGVYLVLANLNSHSEFSGLGVLMGAGLLAAGAIYAGVSSLLVWKFSSTTGQVFAVHGAIASAAAVLYLAPRLFDMVPR